MKDGWKSINLAELVRELEPLIARYFRIYDLKIQPNNVKFYVYPVFDDLILKRGVNEIWKLVNSKGGSLSIKEEYGELVIEISFVEQREKVWINILLALATFLTTTFMGAFMFGVNPIENPLSLVKGLPFSLSLMLVLGSHELGHYIVARKRGMKTSLPYFIPFPSFIGTLGAVIRHKGPIPDRRALFDVGASGPFIGLVVSIVITAVGLSLPVPAYPSEGEKLMIGLPPLFLLVAKISVGSIPEYMHPVAFAGWIGMFVTLLNLIPVGQLDGGHMVRAMLGRKASLISRTFPFLLIILGVVSGMVYGESSSIWIFWGIFTMLFSLADHPPPLDDEIEIDTGRKLFGIVVFILGIMSFTPLPLMYVQ
jgi:membrane-associated protease RseP (regulator of RpoE activity)